MDSRSDPCRKAWQGQGLCLAAWPWSSISLWGQGLGVREVHRPRPPGLCDKHGTEVLRKGGQGMALQTSDKRAPGPEPGPGGWRAEELGPGGGPECPTLSSEGVEREGADAGNRFLSTLCGALHLTPSHPSPQGPAHTSPPHPPSIASILCPLPSWEALPSHPA